MGLLIKILLALLLFSRSEDPPTIPPTPPPEPYLTCELGEAKNCTLEENIGACRNGIQRCVEDNNNPMLATIWGECEQSVFPSEEICDNIDNDCNGTLDEVKPQRCHPPGYEGLGLVYNSDNPYSICHMGYLGCEAGEWLPCEGYTGPENEVCDGIDNNCNGVIDNDVDYGECGYGEEGMCAMGTNYCIEGDLYCVDAILPEFETCDNIDNDCDGDTDEDLSRVCNTICETGQEICEAGHWVNCTARQPQEEVCNNFDDDCDGQIDNGIYCECTDGDIQACPATPCGWGLQICEGGEWSECEGEIPEDEMCNNHDDDCDTEIDEDLIVVCYEAAEATLLVGECLPGESICVAGAWSECIGQVLPSDEVCDGLDNDCDGVVDNPELFSERMDIVFVLDVSGSMCDFVDSLIIAISDYTATLSGSEHSFAMVIHGYDSDGSYLVLSNLTDIVNFLDAIAEQACTDGSVEPTWDIIYDLASPSNVLSMAWRSDATPVVIVVGDEMPQTVSSIYPEDIITVVDPCMLPGCNSITNEYWVDGDPLEIFVITVPSYFVHYQLFVLGGGLRFYDLAGSSRSVAISLDIIFQEICVDG